MRYKKVILFRKNLGLVFWLCMFLLALNCSCVSHPRGTSTATVAADNVAAGIGLKSGKVSPSLSSSAAIHDDAIGRSTWVKVSVLGLRGCLSSHYKDSIVQVFDREKIIASIQLSELWQGKSTITISIGKNYRFLIVSQRTLSKQGLRTVLYDGAAPWEVQIQGECVVQTD